jgi:phosphoribosylformylglycinamidine synthase
MRVEQAAAPFLSRARPGQILRIPVKHGEGAYYAPPAQLAELEAAGQVTLRYCEPDGSVTAAANPNGASANIASVRSLRGNVMGLMPHPEHAVEPAIGGTDGLVLLGSLVDAVTRRGAAA